MTQGVIRGADGWICGCCPDSLYCRNVAPDDEPDGDNYAEASILDFMGAPARHMLSAFGHGIGATQLREMERLAARDVRTAKFHRGGRSQTPVVFHARLRLLRSIRKERMEAEANSESELVQGIIVSVIDGIAKAIGKRIESTEGSAEHGGITVRRGDGDSGNRAVDTVRGEDSG